jgi:two-component system, NtrC family, sensor histidine kinase HydH
MAALPLVLLFSSLRTLRELNEQRAIYLRHRVSLLVSRLENLDSALDIGALRERLAEEDPYLADLRVISRPDEPGAGDLAALWNGRELFRTELTRTSFRADVPFHTRGGLHIAHIELDPAAADFLLTHGRHNVIVASIGGLVLVLLSVYSMWAMRRASRLQVRQLELEHLAHIGKMSAVLAHEIRNPLGTIKGFVQLAGERAGEPARSLLDRAVSETQRLEDLVKDLLAYGRPSLPQWKEVHWQDVASAAKAHARHLIGDRPVLLRVSAEPLAWRSDPALLEQALLNLVRNAVEAVPPGAAGEVWIEAERTAAGEIAIRVRDTGDGFPDAVRERLFEPFLTTKASGTGLGLAITRKLAVSLGGTLELRPGREKGVEATLRFPGTTEQGAYGNDSDRG